MATHTTECDECSGTGQCPCCEGSGYIYNETFILTANVDKLNSNWETLRELQQHAHKVKRQTHELTKLQPHNREMYEMQYNEILCQLQKEFDALI